MNAVVLAIIIAAAFFTLIRYGLARTFALVYLPAILFWYGLPQMSLPGVPNLNAMTAVGYPVLIMLPFCWREVRTLRFNLIDTLVLLMFLPTAISAVLNTSLWDGISRTGDQFFLWILPYFLGRICLQDVIARDAALKVIAICALVIGLFAVYEARMSPYFATRTLKQFGLSTISSGQVFGRFGFMRAQVTTGHSIDLGLCGVLLGTMILVLAPSVGRRWYDPLPFVGLGACGVMVFCSISFTAVGTLATAIALYIVFQNRLIGRKLVVPAVAVVMLAIIVLMGEMLTRDVSERPSDPLQESAWIRAKLLQDAWVTTQNAGFFGAGRYIDVSEVGSGSVDNSYLLFIMQYGWLYLAMWIALAFVVTYKGAQMLKFADTPGKWQPAAAAMAGFVAVLMGMYTVFYGFIYAMLFCVLLGMIATMYQIFLHPPAVAALPAGMPPAGYAGAQRPFDPRSLRPGLGTAR